MAEHQVYTQKVTPDPRSAQIAELQAQIDRLRYSLSQQPDPVTFQHFRDHTDDVADLGELMNDEALSGQPGIAYVDPDDNAIVYAVRYTDGSDAEDYQVPGLTNWDGVVADTREDAIRSMYMLAVNDRVIRQPEEDTLWLDPDNPTRWLIDPRGPFETFDLAFDAADSRKPWAIICNHEDVTHSLCSHCGCTATHNDFPYQIVIDRGEDH